MVLYGWETNCDKTIARLVEAHSKKAIVFFYPIQQPTEEQDGYWHIRLSGETEAIFVRQNAVGEVYMYGPMKGVLID